MDLYISKYSIEYLSNQASVLILIITLTLIGSFIKRRIGWLIVNHLLYFIIIYVILLSTKDDIIWILITALIVITLLFLTNSKSFREAYNIYKANLLNYNLLAIALSMLSNLAFSRFYV